MNATKGGRVFGIKFFGEVKGYMKGRTVKGTAARYAAQSGLHADDSDLKVVPIEDMNPNDRADAMKLGEIKVIK